MANWASAGEMLDAQKSLKGAISYFDLNRMAADYKPIETYFKLKCHSIILRITTVIPGFVSDVRKQG